MAENEVRDLVIVGAGPAGLSAAIYASRAMLDAVTIEQAGVGGQVLTTTSAVVFVCPQGFSLPWLLWLTAALMLMVLYEVAWVRYFKDGERLDGMYQPLGPIPVPIASLPVAAFLLLGIWCQSPIAVVSAVILGIGHIGIHLGHLRELSAR